MELRGSVGYELTCRPQPSTEQEETKGQIGEHPGELELLEPQIVGYVSRQSSTPGPGTHQKDKAVLRANSWRTAEGRGMRPSHPTIRVHPWLKLFP